MKDVKKGKDFFASKTTWGVLIFTLCGLLNRYMGLNIEFEQMLKMIQPATEFGQIVVGPILTAWGTRSAKKPITSVAGIKIPRKGSDDVE